MGREKKGKHINGWCIIDKPAVIHSTQVVNKTRWAFDAQKAGHAGTLDQMRRGFLRLLWVKRPRSFPLSLARSRHIISLCHLARPQQLMMQVAKF